jgi:hypothetical protein
MRIHAVPIVTRTPAESLLQFLKFVVAAHPARISNTPTPSVSFADVTNNTSSIAAVLMDYSCLELSSLSSDFLSFFSGCDFTVVVPLCLSVSLSLCLSVSLSYAHNERYS